jgi:hypothetical protein
MPLVIFVKFDNELMIRTCELGSLFIPSVTQKAIHPETGRVCIFRSFPLLLSFGIIIARSQSATLVKAIIDFEKEFLCQQSYVALSMVMGLEDLMILDNNLDLTRFTDHAFFRSYNKLMMNLSRLELDSNEKKNLLPRMEEFETAGNELIFPLEQ